MNRRSVALVVALVATAGLGGGSAARADDRAVRKELEAVYARFIQSEKAKDPSAALRFLEEETTPDFITKGRRGTRTRQDLMDELKSGKEPWVPVRSIRIKIDQLTVQGDEAIAVVSGQIHAVVRDPKDTGDPAGKRHRFDTRTTHRDTWVKTPAGWKLKTDEELTATLTRDGKPFTPPAPPAGQGEKTVPY